MNFQNVLEGIARAENITSLVVRGDAMVRREERGRTMSKRIRPQNAIGSERGGKKGRRKSEPVRAKE